MVLTTLVFNTEIFYEKKISKRKPGFLLETRSFKADFKFIGIRS